MSLVVGLTGGIGTGKSVMLAALGEAGAQTICLDRMAHELSRKGGALHRRIVGLFGRACLDASGEIDRRALGRKVFAAPRLRRRLEQATHPILLREMRRRIRASRRPVIVADVPLLFEAGLAREFDATVVVSAPRPEALRRVQKRDGLGRSEVLRRMRAQMPASRKEALADVVVRNRGNLKELRREAREYYRAFELIAKSGKK